MRALAPFTALLFSTALLVTGTALQNALVPLRGEVENFGSLWVGGLGSGFFLGYALGCFFAPLLVARAGHIRVFAAFVGLMSGMIILHPLAIDPAIWVGLRIMTGLCMASLYIIIESWLNERTDNANRGLVMSFYVMINFATIAAGQMLLTTYPLESFALFTIASVLVSFAAVPLALSRATQPAPLYAVRLNLKALYTNSPAGLIGTFGVGASTGAFWAFGGVYATRSGLSTDGAAFFLSAAIIGAGLVQWPVGRLSDKIDRRLVLVGLQASACLVCLAVFMAAPRDYFAVMMGGFFVGAAIFPTYAVAVAHAYDHAENDQHVTLASGLLLVFSIGSIIGPMVAAALIEQTGQRGLFLFIGLVQGLVLLFVIMRLLRSNAVAVEEKEDFSFATTAPVGAVLADGDLQDQDIDLIEAEAIVFEGDDLEETADDPPRHGHAEDDRL